MMSGTSVLSATVMTAAVAMAVAAQPIKMKGTSTIRAVPRSRMVARIAEYSSSFLTRVLLEAGLVCGQKIITRLERLWYPS